MEQFVGLLVVVIGGGALLVLAAVCLTFGVF